MSLDTGDGDTQEFSPAQVGVPLPIFAHDVRLSSAEVLEPRKNLVSPDTEAFRVSDYLLVSGMSQSFTEKS